jgi:hypothetical protein
MIVELEGAALYGGRPSDIIVSGVWFAYCKGCQALFFFFGGTIVG